MRLLVVACALFLAGCPKPPPPGPPPPREIGDLPFCSPDADPDVNDLCGTFTTPMQFACVRCKTAMGCVDERTMTYCVIGDCALDGRCGLSLKSTELQPRSWRVDTVLAFNVSSVGVFAIVDHGQKFLTMSVPLQTLAFGGWLP